MSTKKGAGHGKGHGHGTSDLDKLKKVVGITFRIGLDLVASVTVLFLLWRMGIDERTMSTGFNWTVKATATGTAKVLVPLWYLNPVGVLLSFLDNLWEWETITFALDTAVVTFITFCAYVLWRNWWLGGTFLVLGIVSMTWIITMWALQIFGQALPLVIMTIGSVAVIVKFGVWSVKTLWSFAEPAPAH